MVIYNVNLMPYFIISLEDVSLPNKIFEYVVECKLPEIFYQYIMKEQYLQLTYLVRLCQ